jgi:hypothetical protein
MPPGDTPLIWTCKLEREWVGLKDGAITRRERDWGAGVAEREGVWERVGLGVVMPVMAIRGKLSRARMLYWAAAADDALTHKRYHVP